MTQEEMNVLVPQKLRELEKEYGITVLWAVESGSRAWGFASPDSDFDVRFIYKRNTSDYLKLKPNRDVIELPIDDTWDVSGWDLDKTLKLLHKSNPTIYEWMFSPIVYVTTPFKQNIGKLMEQCFNEKKMLYHYLYMAKNDIRTHLMSEQVKPKKYFYALRPVLCCMWIQKYHCAPPVAFSDLYDSVLPKEQKKTVDYLLDLKINSPEKAEIPTLKDMNEFLDLQVGITEEYLKTVQTEKDVSWEELDRFFLDEITNNPF